MKSKWFCRVMVVALMLEAGAGWANDHHHPAPDLPEGIVSVDTFSRHDLKQMIEAGYRDEIPWEEAFGEFVDVNAYIPGLTVQETYDYFQDIYHLEDWTISVRNVEPLGQLDGKNRYVAAESMPPGGNIYLLEEKHPDTHTVDWWVGHSPDDIWMHYYVRVIDAQAFIGRPGVLLTWVNFGHANFEQDPILMQGFLMMRIAHAVERDNMVKILNWRAAGNTGPVDEDVKHELELFDVENYDPMDIWSAVASQMTPTVAWSDLYGGFISSHFYVPDIPKEVTWAYLSDPKNMAEWTVSLRNIHTIPCNNRFIGIERLSPQGLILGEMSISEESCSFDLRMSVVGRYQRFLGNTKWMTSSIRVLDGQEAVGKPGSVVVWTTYRHAAYDALPELKEEWKFLPVRNMFAVDNVTRLLE